MMEKLRAKKTLVSGKSGCKCTRGLLNKQGMEMVQVAILVAIAVTVGLIFKEQITQFVNNTFGSLSSAKF